MALLKILFIFILTLGLVTGNVLQFSKMIKFKTGDSSLKYNNYGCWCGYKGKGDIKDALDKCCYHHDQCYYSAMDDGCRWLKRPLLITYKYSLESSTGKIKCYDTPGSCKYRACDCDRIAAYCFSVTPYNSYYKGWNKKNC